MEKYYLTIIALVCLINIHNNPSEILQRANELTRKASASPSEGSVIQQAINKEELIPVSIGKMGISSFQMENTDTDSLLLTVDFSKAKQIKDITY